MIPPALASTLLHLQERLARTPPALLVLVTLIGASVSSAFVCLFFHGVVLPEYPITGAVVATMVSPPVVYSIHRYRRELEEANATLEARVLERTAALELARWEADAANRLKSEFLATMSHELRTPINGVLGMLDLMARTRLDPEQMELLGFAAEGTHQMRRLVEDILELARFEAGGLDLERAPFDLREIAERAQQMKAPTAREKGLKFSLWIAPQTPPGFYGDARRLQQVLLLLLDNAVKFTERGEITAEIFCEPLPGESAALTLLVRDTGVGIPREHLSSIFEKFTQVDGSFSRRFGGAGIGLAICKHLVDQMEGTLHVTSHVGAGSTFEVNLTLPICRELERQLSA